MIAVYSNLPWCLPREGTIHSDRWAQRPPWGSSAVPPRKYGRGHSWSGQPGERRKALVVNWAHHWWRSKARWEAWDRIKDCAKVPNGAVTLLRILPSHSLPLHRAFPRNRCVWNLNNGSDWKVLNLQAKRCYKIILQWSGGNSPEPSGLAHCVRYKEHTNLDLPVQGRLNSIHSWKH